MKRHAILLPGGTLPEVWSDEKYEEFHATGGLVYAVNHAGEKFKHDWLLYLDSPWAIFTEARRGMEARDEWFRMGKPKQFPTTQVGHKDRKTHPPGDECSCTMPWCLFHVLSTNPREDEVEIFGWDMIGRRLDGDPWREERNVGELCLVTKYWSPRVVAVHGKMTQYARDHLNCN